MIDAFMSEDTHQERIIIKLEDAEKTKSQLLKNGCEYKKTFTQQETYLKQPEQEILKIVEEEGDAQLVRLQQNNEKLDVVKQKPLTQKQIQELISHYTTTKQLTSTVTEYAYGEILVRVIENKHGVFCTLQAETIGSEIYEELGFTKPTTITSFAFL